MPPSAAKIALSLPADLLREVERARKKSGKSRSALVQDALRLWLRSENDASLVREWEEGYRRMPEGRAEIEAAEASGKLAFDPGDDW